MARYANGFPKMGTAVVLLCALLANTSCQESSWNVKPPREGISHSIATDEGSQPALPILPQPTQASGGNAGGYSGPHFPNNYLSYSDRTPFSRAVINTINHRCTMTGDPGTGLVSIAQRLYWDIAQKPLRLSKNSLRFLESIAPATGFTSLTEYLDGSFNEDFNNIFEELSTRHPDGFSAVRDEELWLHVRPLPPRTHHSKTVDALEDTDPVQISGIETLVQLTNPQKMTLNGAGHSLPVLIANSGELPAADSVGEESGSETEYIDGVGAIIANYGLQDVKHIPLYYENTGKNSGYQINAEDHASCLMGELQSYTLLGSDYDTSLSSSLNPQYEEDAYAASRKDTCPELKGWLKARDQLDSKKEYSARVEAADQLFSRFRRDKELNLERVYRCLQLLPDRQNFLNTLNQRFFHLSKEILKETADERMQRMLFFYDRKQVNGSFSELKFSAMREKQNLSLLDSTIILPPASWPAAYNRTSGGLFFDLTRIRYDDWFTFFIHELLHKADPNLTNDGSYVDKTRLIKGIGENLEQSCSWSEISQKQRHDMVSHALQGLATGLWGEYRTWYATLELHRAGVEEGLWPESPFINNLMKELEGYHAGTRQALYSYMKERANLEFEGVWEQPLAKELLKTLVRMHEEGTPGTPPLFELGLILNEPTGLPLLAGTGESCIELKGILPGDGDYKECTDPEKTFDALWKSLLQWKAPGRPDC